MVVYELPYGVERIANPAAEHAGLDFFLGPFVALTSDDACARKCAGIRRELERTGGPIGPHDSQIAATALHHGLTLVTHNTRESGRIPGLKLDD